MDARVEQASLFGAPPLPCGLAYRPDFLTESEESALLAAFSRLAFREATYHQYLARRRVVRYGAFRDDNEERWLPGEPMPTFLERIAVKAATWVDVPVHAFVHALVTEYKPGTPIGWHRDSPAFGFVVGISLGAACRMRFRPFEETADGPRAGSLDLAPRSAYVIHGPLRWGWQHSIPPTNGLRYSITLRTRADGVREPGPGFRG